MYILISIINDEAHFILYIQIDRTKLRNLKY